VCKALRLKAKTSGAVLEIFAYDRRGEVGYFQDLYIPPNSRPLQISLVRRFVNSLSITSGARVRLGGAANRLELSEQNEPRCTTGGVCRDVIRVTRGA
jgi:hypothetical protein